MFTKPNIKIVILSDLYIAMNIMIIIKKYIIKFHKCAHINRTKLIYIKNDFKINNKKRFNLRIQIYRALWRILSEELK